MTVSTNAPICGAVRSMPYIHARKRSFIGDDSVRLTLNTDTANGSTNPLEDADRPRRSRPPCMSAGSEAIDDRVLIATSCAGRTACAKRRMDTPDPMAVIGYSNAQNTSITTHWMTMKAPRRPAASTPVRRARR